MDATNQSSITVNQLFQHNQYVFCQIATHIVLTKRVITRYSGNAWMLNCQTKNCKLTDTRFPVGERTPDIRTMPSLSLTGFELLDALQQR